MTNVANMRVHMPFVKYVAENEYNKATKPQGPKRSIFERIDEGIGLNWLKKNVKKYTGITYLSNKITEAVDDGDDNKLSLKERLWEGVKGAGKAVENFIGSQGLAFMGVLALGNYAAALAGVGKAFSILTKGYFLFQGTKLAYKGTKEFVKADTKDEARNGATTAATGGIMLYGTLNSIIKEVKAYDTAKSAFKTNVETSRAKLEIPDGEILTETTLKQAYRQAAINNHPDKGGSEAAMAEVTAAFEFLSKNMKSASKIRTSAVPAPTVETPAPTTSAQPVSNPTGEMGLVLASHYNNVKPLIVPLNPVPNTPIQTSGTKTNLNSAQQKRMVNSLKMSQLKGIDRFVASKYQINPQKFKTIEDFNKHCEKLAKEIAKTDFGGRQQETQIQRKAMIDEWFNYVTKENDAYTGAMQYMILRAITSDLKPNEDTLPAVLNKGVLANTVSEVQKTLESDPKALINFVKTYKNNLQKSMLQKETALDENLNGWIKIPSKIHDPENFEANVDKLKMLSHNSWCTKSFNAEPYLADGDFHVYMEKGKPKLGVRFIGDEIQEIQGELNDSKIPIKYGNIAKDHVKDYGLKENAKEELQHLEKVKRQMKRFKAKFLSGIENASTQKILTKYGIKCKKDSDGLLIISHYGNGKYEFRLSDLEIDENKLFKDIKKIEGDADFSDSKVQNLGKLESIGENAYFANSQIKDLGNLQSIGGHADFRKSQIKDLGNLQSIGGDATFIDSQVQSLGNLQSIGGNANFQDSQVQSLGNLQSIGENANFQDSQIKDLCNLRTIGGWAYFTNSQVQSLGKLQSIGGCAYFSYSQVQSLGNLQSISQDALLRSSQVEDLGNLRTIGGYADFENSRVQNLGNLQLIGGDAFIGNCPLSEKDFENTKIGGNIKK